VRPGPEFRRRFRSSFRHEGGPIPTTFPGGWETVLPKSRAENSGEEWRKEWVAYRLRTTVNAENGAEFRELTRLFSALWETSRLRGGAVSLTTTFLWSTHVAWVVMRFRP
jgi:hypothetical protein